MSQSFNLDKKNRNLSHLTKASAFSLSWAAKKNVPKSLENFARVTFLENRVNKNLNEKIR